MRSRGGWRLTGLLVAVACLFALGTAWWAQHIAGMAPCPLCLWERWPYRIVLLLGLLLIISPRTPARWIMALIIVVLLGGAAIAFVHVGVEQRWWPSPLPSCGGIALHGSASEIMAQLPARPGVPCDQPTYPVPALPVSFATIDLLFALLLAMAVGIALSRLRRTPLIFFGRS